MKSLVSAALAVGFAAALSTSAFAECASKNISADAGTMTPIVTADTTVKTGDKS